MTEELLAQRLESPSRTGRVVHPARPKSSHRPRRHTRTSMDELSLTGHSGRVLDVRGRPRCKSLLMALALALAACGKDSDTGVPSAASGAQATPSSPQALPYGAGVVTGTTYAYRIPDTCLGAQALRFDGGTWIIVEPVEALGAAVALDVLLAAGKRVGSIVKETDDRARLSIEGVVLNLEPLPLGRPVAVC